MTQNRTKSLSWWNKFDTNEHQQICIKYFPNYNPIYLTGRMIEQMFDTNKETNESK